MFFASESDEIFELADEHDGRCASAERCAS
jgi:hypothetical protein